MIAEAGKHGFYMRNKMADVAVQKKWRPVDDLKSKNSAVSTSEISEVQHLYGSLVH